MSWFDKPQSLIPEGEYDATIFDVQFNPLADLPKLTIVYKIKDQNRKSFQNFKFNDGGRKWLTWQMNALDVLDRARELAQGSEDTETVARAFATAVEEIKGQWVTLKITHREFEGKTYESSTVTSRTIMGAGLAPELGFDKTEEIPF